MDWDPGSNGGAGDTPEPGLPGLGLSDSRPSGFAAGGEWDACPPSAELAVALENASGPEWRCPGATRDEMVGLLRQWQALESWAAAGKLGVLRALVRDDGQPLPNGGYRGDLPEGWTRSLTHEVALALSMPTASAERLMWLAWNLQALLPGTGELLATGELTLAKARAVDTALNLLSPEDAAGAEAMIVSELPGKTYGQVQQLAVQAALAADPQAGTRRRQDAERHKSRVHLFREETGAAGLSGRDLPTDQALTAHASVCARAEEYKASGAFPGDTRMDQYRAAAYLDLLNGIPGHMRIASGDLATADRTTDTAEPGPEERDNDTPEGGGPDGNAPGDGPRGGTNSGRLATPTPVPAFLRPTELIIPLATLLGLAERPGEGHRLGPLDPTLCRDLASAAAGSHRTQLCVTVTDADGTAVGHGCGRLPKKLSGVTPARDPLSADPNPPPALPARVNLTITAARLAQLAAATGPPGRGSWSFTRNHDPGPPGGLGGWTLTLPDGRQLTVHLEPVPTRACDHRHESHAYQPNAALRHLVQIRDGQCTFPPCSRHARESDFEHAVPYDKGGRTCACNAGARSRACHQVKQSSGWNVSQPRPGWHQWTTPAGRTYTQGPKHYPA